ncbi:hypothetical protein BegalDRAFT_2841, partial [Beggiatoa alba B18LD]
SFYNSFAIAEVLGVELKNLLNFDEKIILNIGSFRDKNTQCQYYINSAVELTQELEKLRLQFGCERKRKSVIK